jgi:hypothetical protein
MAQKLRTLSLLTLTAFFVSGVSTAEAASTGCLKVNEVRTIKNKENTCTKVSGKLVWKTSKVGIPEIKLSDFQPIPDGFSIGIENFDSNLSWDVAAPSGEASLDDFGLVTVTGNLLPNDALTIKASKGRFFRAETYSGKAFALKTLDQPVLAPIMKLNSNGISIQILNYDPEKYWEVNSSEGSAYIDNEGFLEISDLENSGTIEIFIKLGADGFRSISKSYTYLMPDPAPTPIFSAISNQTTNSFEFSILNFDPKYKWTASATTGSASILSNGVVRITGLVSNQSSSVTIVVSKEGMRDSVSTQTGSSLAIYSNLTEREWALIAKDPSGNSGRLIIVYGYITQFDAATGLSQFRADVSGVNARTAYGFTGDNTFMSGDASLLHNFVAKDYFVAKVIVRGSKTYTTTLNGTITVPQLEIVEITRL